MTFLNPLVLLGLAAASIPIVLHLLNLRKLRTIEFSTLTFLKELQKNQMRKIKIRQWLLLLLRTLLIILLVLAFSRPALRGSFATLGTHTATTAVIIIDDTPSMGRQNESGTYIAQARAGADRIVSLLKEGDEAMFIRLSEVPQPTVGKPTHDFLLLRKLIRETEITPVRHSLGDGLHLAAGLLAQSRNFNKEIYLFTDGQKSTVSSAGDEGTAGSLADEHARLFINPLADRSVDNVGIENVEVVSSLLRANRPVTIRATIRNYGSAAVRNEVVSLLFDGRRVMQKSVTLDGGAAATLELDGVPGRSGDIAGAVKIEDDAFEADNERSFTLTIPPRIRVLLATSDPAGTRYLALALSTMNADTTGPSLSLRTIAPAQITSPLLDNADVVILADVASVSSDQAALLASFLQTEGRGIILAPGPMVNVGSYNAALLPALGLPALEPRGPGNSAGFLTFGAIDWNHPIFRGMFDERTALRPDQRTIDAPHIMTSAHFRSESGLRQIIGLPDKSSFFWEARRTSGRILGFSAGVTPEWSDFPFKGVFVPLLTQSVLYAAEGFTGANASLAGEHLTIRLDRSERGRWSPDRPLSLVAPSGSTTLVQPVAGARGIPTVEIARPTETGVYRLVQSNDTLALAAVNPDPAESDPTLASDADYEREAGRVGVKSTQVSIVRNSSALSGVVLQSRYGIELWRYFLIAALLVALIEILVAREPKTEAATA